MTPNKNNLKDSFIILPLPNFYFHHSPSEIDEKDNRLIGREKLKKEFKSIFNNDISSKGVYLVTGYRGMGKTSFVNQTILEITRTYNFRPYFLWLFQMLIITFGLSFINYREIKF
ncbi:MAG: ATP-binding protein [Salinivirgaceae bacterium]|nr:ATP-binding protein [Salinivirgaceae bacterium]